MVVFVYLDLLRLEDLPSAVAEAETIAGSPSVPALVLSACINILATQAEQMPDDQFEPIAERVLALCRRFDQAPDLDQAGTVARGLVLLQPRNRAPSSGPNLAGSTGIRTRPADLSRWSDARPARQAPDL